MEHFKGSQVILDTAGVHLRWDPTTGLSGCMTTYAQSGGNQGFYIDPSKSSVVEIAVTIPAGNGWWPAFWGLGGGDGKYSWPPEKDWF